MGIKLLLFFPFLEIIFFILFGDILGFFNVIIWIIFSGLIGFYFLTPKKSLEGLYEIGNEPVDWICKRLAGIFLIIPGFVTDFIGIILLVKPLRNIVIIFVPESLKKFTTNFNKNYETKKKDTKSNIIEGEYKDLDE